MLFVNASSEKSVLQPWDEAKLHAAPCKRSVPVGLSEGVVCERFGDVGCADKHASVTAGVEGELAALVLIDKSTKFRSIFSSAQRTAVSVVQALSLPRDGHIFLLVHRQQSGDQGWPETACRTPWRVNAIPS